MDITAQIQKNDDQAGILADGDPFSGRNVVVVQELLEDRPGIGPILMPQGPFHGSPDISRQVTGRRAAHFFNCIAQKVGMELAQGHN
jgi:hypothetical protein